ncbi:MarR family transcriptional regulator [Alphaproteobacteria bacterium]|jgi:MarR family transcriptional regulator, transcriptional regulator for hemolysin|nr:MarR family transcriptional regulator [Rhodospirillaceae bacterium]MBT7732934.1 MarR family transcriptional regulator [Rhodospirillaceae bacterium]MDC0998470.1 MarR family transcriptional regulator [Alphaproteobacteria bacterium]
MERENLDRNFGFLLHDVSRLMRTVFDRRGRDLGLTRSQWWVLTMLYAKEGVTQSELADFMDLEKPTLGRLLDRMQEKHWIERRPDSLDRRVNRLYLTEKVQEIMRALRKTAADVRKDALGDLVEVDRENFIDTLIKIKNNLSSLES